MPQQPTSFRTLEDETGDYPQVQEGNEEDVPKQQELGTVTMDLEAGGENAHVNPETKVTPKELAAADEALLGNSIDFGEWADARKSRINGAKRTPKDTSVLGRAFITWMYKVVFKGWRQPLSKDDLPGLNPDYLSASLYPRFHDEWEKVGAEKGTTHGFQRAMLRVPQIRFTIILGSILSATQGVLATVGRPLILKTIVSAVESDADTKESIILIVIFAIIVGIEGWAGVMGRQLLAEEFGTQFQICASSAVYNKMLRIDTQRQQPGQSSESSLIGNDIVRAYENIRIAAQLPMALSSVIGGVVVLIVLVGKSSLIGIGIMLLILILNMLMGKITHGIEQKNLKAADERLSMLSAVLEGIRAVKLFGWEEKYRNKMNEVRDEECVHIRNYRLAHVTSIASGRASPVLSAMATLVFYAMSRTSLDLADAYAAVSVFQALRLGLIFVPLCMTAFLAFDVTLKRLNEYFGRPDKAKRSYLPNPTPGTNAPLVELDPCSLGWVFTESDEGIILRDVQLKVNPGEIVAIVGGVGEGKSTLLATVAQAIQPLRWSNDTHQSPVRTTKSIGFAPQKPFVVCGTLKQNVLLGRPFDQKRFDNALFASGLHTDIPNLPGGIYTEIGERGTTLSGGQQARMAVARSLYAEPRLLCFDDILAAVDAKMCAHMFEHAILRQVRPSASSGPSRSGRACVVAMNQLALLPRVDRIVYIGKGRVLASGSYDELLESCTEFSEFVECTKLLQEETEEDAEIVKGVSHIKLDSDVNKCSPVEEAEDIIRGSSRHYGGYPQQMSNTTPDGPIQTILGTEKLTQGNVTLGVYKAYVKAVGPLFMLTALILCMSGYVMMALNDYWLTRWSEAMDDPNNTRTKGFFAGVYAALSIGFGMMIMTTSWMLCFGGVRASRSLHHSMLTRLLRAPLEWFESNSSGRIMSRFSGDLSKVDMILSLTVDNWLQILCTLLVQLGVICYAVPIAAALIVVVAVLFSMSVVAADRSSRESRRIANSNLSPLLSNAGEATRGRDVAAVMETGPFFEARHRLASDEYARANFVAGSIINWCQLMAHYLSFSVAVFSTLMLVLLRNAFGNSDLLALVIVYCVNLPYFAAMLTQISIRMNSYFTSYERLLEYETLKEEDALDEKALELYNDYLDPKPPASQWPTKGAIEFRNVELRYRPGAPLVLKGVTFTVQGGQSLGICGRTGAGKSSTISCLFRLRPISGGAVLVDGRDVGTIDLNILRNRITIIPQDPVLISGTLATNLDPFGETSAEEMREALQIVGLGNRVSLDDPVEASGRNWSAGERQLICFARALLRPNKVLVLDEPSSAIDLNTDDAIHEMIREQFYRRRRCTVLCIAHRLQTIATYDRIAVMQDGEVLEFGSPMDLLHDDSSELHSMVSALGPASQQHIRDLAARAQSEGNVVSKDTTPDELYGPAS